MRTACCWLLISLGLPFAVSCGRVGVEVLDLEGDASSNTDEDGAQNDPDASTGIECPEGRAGDADLDGVCDARDNCPAVANAAQLDRDSDGAGDVCDDDDDGDGVLDVADSCPDDNPNDSDGDGVCDSVDVCTSGDDALDGDRDGTADACDACPLSNPNDTDGDGVCTDADVCEGSDDKLDADTDGAPDGCDPCPADASNDGDGDGVCADADNCPLVANAGQEDGDGDATGDACDQDSDEDGTLDGSDNCAALSNPDQLNSDGDALGDACDTDDDGDGALDGVDNCPLVGNGTQADTDGDGTGDACDDDSDGDGTPDASDNCALVSNPAQADIDGDALGDACDTDDDGDGDLDGADNCPVVSNGAQTNTDGDEFGDACDSDDDNDARPDASDNCPLIANADQANQDGDALGDACDPDYFPTGIRVRFDHPAAGATLTNFPVRVQLDTRPLISSGQLAADCSNLRVVGATGCRTDRPFFLPQHTCNTASTELWVRVPQLLPGRREVLALTFATGGSPSNGSQVFPFFDGFDGTSLDLTRWKVYGPGTYSVSNGVLQSQRIMLLESTANAVTAGTSTVAVRMAALGQRDTDVELGVGRLSSGAVIWSYGRSWDGFTFLSYDIASYAFDGPAGSTCDQLTDGDIQPSIGSPWVDHPPATATFLLAEFSYANVSNRMRASLQTSRGASLSYTAPAGCTLPTNLPILITLDHNSEASSPIQRVDYVYVRPTTPTPPSAAVILSSSEACGTSP